jgi:hypothetical protein
MRADLLKKMVSVTRPRRWPRIEEQRLVVAALGLPALDRFRRHALDAELHARHVVGRVDDEEQREGDQVHPDQDRQGVEQAADEIGEHPRV